MKVYHIPAAGKPGRVVPGPADLMGESGRVILSGTADTRERVHWITALGAFATRGGSIEWRRP